MKEEEENDGDKQQEMKILYLSPSHFSDRSVVGGGERYAYELARAMARKAQVRLLCRAAKASIKNDGPLEIRHITTLFSGDYFNSLCWADVIHCHQIYYLQTDLTIMLARVLGKKVFVSDLGGGQKFALSYHLPMLKAVTGFLMISEYSKTLWQEKHPWTDVDKIKVVYGGVDIHKFQPAQSSCSKRVLFVGRILPHKGIDDLIEAVQGDIALDVVGRIYDEKYYDYLKAKAKNKDVTFYHSLNDSELIKKYRECLVTVQPSVYKAYDGKSTAVPELLGLASLESMACGRPAIVTQVASLPEIVKDGKTGFIVPPNNPLALRMKIKLLMNDSHQSCVMGEEARKHVVSRFTWDCVAQKCLSIYKNNEE